MYLALLCVLVFTSSGYGEDDRAALNRVNAGINAGNAIIKFLGNEKVSETFATIAKNIGPFLSAIGPVVSFMAMLKPTPEMQVMKEKFKEMDEKFDQVFTKFDEVNDLIQETSLKSQYGQYEHTILGLSSRLQQFLSASPLAAEGQKETFMDAYESTYGTATYNLWRAMMEETSLSDNIPETAIEYTNNHRGRVQKIMKEVANLIMQGVKVHLTYLKAKGRNHTYEEDKNTWEDRITGLFNHMQSVDEEVTDAWHAQVGTDLNSKLASLNGQSHEDFADNFYAFLTEKYDWRDWHIVVYNKINGESNHWVKSGCDGYRSFDKQGRNIVIASVEQGKKSIDTTDAKKKLEALKTTRIRNRFFFPYRASDTAKNVFNKLPSEFKNGCTYPAVGVIKKNANVEHRAPSSRLAVVENGSFKLHAFG